MKGTCGNYCDNHYSINDSTYYSMREKGLKNMKITNKGVLLVTILGVPVTIDYENNDVTFPEDLREKEIEYLAWYLSEEGFLDGCDMDNNN